MVTLVPHNQCCKALQCNYNAQCVHTLSYTLLLLFDARAVKVSRAFHCMKHALSSSCSVPLFLACERANLFELRSLCSRKFSIAKTMLTCRLHVCACMFVCAHQNHDCRLLCQCVCERVFEGIVRFAVDFVNFCHSIASTSALALASTLASLWRCNCLFNFSFCPIRFANDARVSERANRPARYTAYSAEKRSSC